VDELETPLNSTMKNSPKIRVCLLASTLANSAKAQYCSSTSARLRTGGDIKWKNQSCHIA
jgi:hypothetical protein